MSFSHVIVFGVKHAVVLVIAWFSVDGSAQPFSNSQAPTGSDHNRQSAMLGWRKRWREAAERKKKAAEQVAEEAAEEIRRIQQLVRELVSELSRERQEEEE